MRVVCFAANGTLLQLLFVATERDPIRKYFSASPLT